MSFIAKFIWQFRKEENAAGLNTKAAQDPAEIHNLPRARIPIFYLFCISYVT